MIEHTSEFYLKWLRKVTFGLTFVFILACVAVCIAFLQLWQAKTAQQTDIFTLPQHLDLPKDTQVQSFSVEKQSLFLLVKDKDGGQFLYQINAKTGKVLGKTGL